MRVNKIVVTHLRNVRTWVTRRHVIDWRMFSPDLSAAPPTEAVAVCVVSKADGTPLALPGDSRKARAAVVIVSPTGSTLYAAGDTLGMTVLLSELRQG